MYVIGHYDVATNGDIVLPRFGAENTKCFVHLRSCEKALTFMCIERDEVKRSRSIKQATQPWWPPRPFFLTARHTLFGNFDYGLGDADSAGAS